MSHLFEGSCVVLPERSPDSAELIEKGYIALPMPDYGMQMWTQPKAIATLMDRLPDVVHEVSKRVIDLERARTSTWRKNWKGANVTSLGIRIKTR